MGRKYIICTIFSSINFVDLFLIHFDHGLPLDLEGGPDLAAGNTEVPWDDHPLLNLLRVADRLLVGGVNSSLDTLHNLGVRPLHDVLHCACIATD